MTSHNQRCIMLRPQLAPPDCPGPSDRRTINPPMPQDDPAASPFGQLANYDKRSHSFYLSMKEQSYYCR